ncbi:deoxyribodipyrimidine photo-lyase isoform X2 [Carica papaya]|uniref:deoxyribodipyrimidine photo-lyase isoform X2 n=1 Tax=Carica papaya TaxID=3649 RepID=UPI000B8CE01B|nr:deoxyribodipyrimidine photo-lyase isoform X2 [Carica papaya]
MASIASIQSGRFRVLKEGSRTSDQAMGPVVYWMFRDQRLKDNWALIHAVDQANKANVPVAIAFNLFDQFLGAKARQLGFMLRGLRQLHRSITETLQIPFILFQGKAEDTIPNFLRECGASLLVTDFSPLQEIRRCKEQICKKVTDSVVIHEVDAHNIVPVWVASDKLEYSAKTIRGKINKLLPEYLIDFPTLQSPNREWALKDRVIDWDGLIDDVLRKGAEVPEIEWCEPGEDAAREVLMGDISTTMCLKGTESPQTLSSVDTFLEELIVRRELADNFCFYQPHYDSLKGAWGWAQTTLLNHASDKREQIYTREQFEKAQTADPLWNAAQLEMVYCGKMHGFMRMYWAKKILEWTREPEEALSISIYLNDKYEIDGRDPSGYVGCMWSICGVHDQGWKERPVFGKIRYMNYAGCKRKFDVDGYIAYVKGLKKVKRKADDMLSPKAKELHS